MITVVSNDDPVSLPDGTTVAGLLEHLGLGAKWVLVERNGEPVERRLLDSVVLQDGDRLELVRAVAGG